MRLIKKIFNKVLFAGVVAIVFALFNRCDVKAYYNGQLSTSNYTTNGDVIPIQETANLFTNVAYGGSSFQYGCENETPYWDQIHVENPIYVGNSIPYCFYTLVNKNNSNSIAIGSNLKTAISTMQGSKPTSQFLYYVKPDNYDFVSIQSVGVGSDKGVNMLIVFNGTAPILTNEGTADNAPYRLTAQSSTDILYYRQGFSYDDNVGYNWSNYPWQYYIHVHLDTGEYMQFNYTNESNIAPLKRLYVYGSTGKDVYYSYISNVDIKWNTKIDTEDEFPKDPDLVPPLEVKFSPNYVKVNNLYVAINVLVSVLNNDWVSNSVYYSFCNEDSDCTYDTLDWVELYYENFLHLEDGDKTTLHFDSNGYLFIKIVDDTTNEVVYATSTHISSLSKQDPDININVNYNSSNNTIIDEILIDTDYNIYSSNLTGYKCYYTFSTTLLENPQTSDFTETDCQVGRLYVAHNNGYYYARITYNDEPVVDIMKEINEYGQLVSTIYNTNSNDIFSKLLGGTNGYLSIYTSNQGPLHSLVSLPLKLGTFIYQFFTLDNACTPYDMGTIFNRHITIGCIDLSILGSPLLHTIDIIFAGFFTITWGLFLYKLLRKIVILKDISVEGVFRGGIF